MTDLDGRVAIVTGGGRGIGRAVAIGLAGAGARVVVAGRTRSTCDDVVRAIGTGAAAVVADVGTEVGRARIVEEAVAAFGGIDILVNNAGLLRPHVTAKVTEAEIDELVAVNVKGPVLLSQLALEHLAAGPGGVIINISALGAFQPMAGIGGYCAVKAAMVNWTSTMAKEWTSRGVRVNALVPGPVETDMILPRDHDARAAFVAGLGAQTLVGRIAQPDDLVAGVLFLAGDGARLMTGRCLFLDGGMLQ